MFALPPATLEGWYALHQALTTDWAALRAFDDERRAGLGREAGTLLEELATPPEGGWSLGYRLVGGGADWMLVHLRPTLDDLAALELRLRRSAPGAVLHCTFDYLSVIEAGMYHATAEVAREHEPGSKAYVQALAERLEQESGSPYLKRRLYPDVPDGMDYLSFYPMTKRRAAGQNWYALPIEERSRLMHEHGLTGRRFAGRVLQVISGSIGLDDWEWGVTLFARDPLEFKRIVTEMRFDEASALYGEFGRFFTGIRIAPADWGALLGGREEAR